MKKRIISILLIISILVTLSPANATELQPGIRNTNQVAAVIEEEQPNPFADISESDWFYSSVMYALEHNIFGGTGADTFSPDGNMTRGMFVTVMGRIAGINPSDYSGSDEFSDVMQDAYYAPYVAWAVENNITDGIGSGRFDPDGIVTREQMAVFTVRYYDAYAIPYGISTDVTSTPADLAGVSGWAFDAVLKLWMAGLLKGDDNGNFNPQAEATRAETAAFTTRVNEKAETPSEPVPTSAAVGTTTPTPTPKIQDKKTVIYKTVNFDANGGTEIAPLSVASGKSITTLPAPQKPDAVFLGWYSDSSLLGDKFTEVTAVISDTTLYAKYMVIEGATETEVDDTYALADQESDLTFAVESADTAMSASDIESAIVLEIMDGSEGINLEVSGSNGVFAVVAEDGFTEGAAYKLTLNDASLNFSGKEAAVRICSFSIKRAESFEVSLNESMIYIPDEDISDMIKNGEAVTSLSIPVVVMAVDEAGTDSTSAGTFNYSGSETLEIGDVLCVYSGEKPESGDDAAFVDDEIAYITVTGINANTISYSNADSDEVIFLPDVLPIYAGAGNALSNYDINATPGSFTTDLSGLNFGQYADMGLDADTTVDVGDYVALYTSASMETAAESDVRYGEVTAVDLSGAMVTVTFIPTTTEAMQESLGYYSKNEIDGDAMLEDVDVAALQSDIEQQLLESGFANDAAIQLTALATATDGFKQAAQNGFDMESYSVVMPKFFSAADLQTSAADSGIEDLTVKATISKNTQKLSSGIRCAVEVSFKVPIDTGDNNEVSIGLTATFVEELKMAVNATGDTVWKKKWIFPYISDYKMSSQMDVYDFTGISFKATVSSNADTQKIDISEEMQKILASTQTNDITAGVQDIFEIYGDMMENETDWITIFSQNIVKNDISLLLGVIQIRISADFVVSADINVALGCNFEYQSGTRYLFWAKLKAKSAGSETIDLMDEVYTFQFYCVGSLGLRAGIKLEIAVGLFSVDLNSVGLTAEAGVYTRAYGYFFYELKSVKGVKTSNKSGALYMELGMYLEVAFKAQVLDGKFQYNPTLYENEWPLLTVGDRYDVYDFAYETTAPILLKGSVKAYALPVSIFNMTSLDLREGDIAAKTYAIDDYEITFTNSNFSLNENNVVVSVPVGSHILTSDMTVLWKDGALAFSSIPISRTYHLVWDDLNAAGYTIHFNSNGGTSVGSITKTYGAAVTAPAAPTKSGYAFGGWHSDAQLTKTYAFTSMGAENITLYAKWTAKADTPYKVKHYMQELGNSSNYTLYETQNLTGATGGTVTPGVKSYTGFSAPAAQTLAIGADGSSSVSYYYTRNSYTLTFNANGGSGGTTTSVKYGAAISAPSVTKTGYSLNGWSSAVAATMPAANTTYTALWTGKTYTVAFDSNGGTSNNSITVIYGNNYATLPTPAKTGYAFAGWFASETGDNGMGTQITSGNPVTSDSAQILYAKWTANTNTAYKVAHYQQQLEGSYTLYETQNLTGTTGAGMTPEVRNYTGFTAPSIQTVTIAADGSTAVRYDYTRSSYTLNFDATGGTGGSSGPVKYGEAITAPTVARTGYSFNNWSSTVAATMPAADTTYAAQWTGNTYTVTFDANGGTTSDDVTVTYGKVYGTLPTPEKTGYTFDGWYVDEADDNGTGNQMTSSTTVSVDSGQTFYAKWTANANTAYTVKHYLQDLDNGANYTLYETQNLTGTTDADVTPEILSYSGFTSPSSQTVTIAANGSAEVRYDYTRNDYTLTFNANGGTGESSSSVKYGAAITAPAVAKAGYTMSGWSPSLAATMPAVDTTYTAQWSTEVSTLEQLNSAMEAGISEVIVTQAIPLPGGTTFDGNGMTVRAKITGMDADGNIQTGSSYSIFSIASGSTVSIKDLTVMGGSVSAITNAGSLTMENVVITQSGGASVSGGGGLRNTGKAILIDCSITGNAALYGGGFLNSTGAFMVMDGCSVTANRSLSSNGGGGGGQNGGSLYINNSTLANNRGTEIGGAINNYMGTLYVMNSTITGNMVNTTSGSVYGGGIGNNSGTVKVVNSLLANNYEIHSGNALPSDIGAYNSETNIQLYNSYCGAYRMSLAATMTPTYSTGSTVNPEGNGLAGIFNSYTTTDGLSVPVLVKLGETFAAPLASDSAALSGGSDVYFTYTIDGAAAVAYGTPPTYLIGAAGDIITVYQGTGTRGSGVIGAVGK